MKTSEKLPLKIWIDASNRNEILVQLKQGNKVTGEKSGQIDIVQSISELLNENGIHPKEVDLFESNLGPGSFTGLKKSVTASNVLNWVLGKKNLTDLKLPEYGSEPNIHKTKYV